jgi:glycosyltransferase involved in cell wall biosynthesis
LSNDKKIQGGLRSRGVSKTSSAEMPLVSVITVVLNGEKFIEETFKSVFAQSYKNIEYIVVDGGSKDDTLDIIKKNEDRIDFWISEKDQGIYYAMNKGITLATGEIIGILNADDHYSKDCVQHVVDAYLRTKADVIHGDIILITGTQSRMKPDIATMNEKPSIFHPTCFVKKSVYQSIGAFDTRYRISSDYDFLLRCLKKGCTFHYVPEVLTYFRPGGMSASCASNIEG